MLFCALTNRYINRKPDEVKGHTSGKKYKKALEQCEQMMCGVRIVSLKKGSLVDIG